MTHPRLRFARSAAGLPASSGWPLFGGWLPLVAFANPPCNADGSPWDGIHYSGYVTTILVMGWLNRAISVEVGRPRRRKSVPDARSLDRALREMDERIRVAQQRSKTGDR